MEQEEKWIPWLAARPQQTNKAAAYSLSIALWRRWVVLDGFGDGSVVEEWEKTMAGSDREKCFPLSPPLSLVFYPSPLSPIRLLPAAGWRRPSAASNSRFFFFFFFVCKEETTWSIWSRLERGGGGHPLLILGYSPDERVCSLHGRAHGHTGRDPWFVVLARSSLYCTCVLRWGFYATRRGHTCA